MSLPIPVELVEYAVDSIHDNIRTLAACALASRALLPRARFHIWREVTVPIEADPPHVRVQGLLEILDFNPDITPLVQSLTLKGVMAPQPRHRIQEHWDKTVLLCAKLPNLRILKFVQLNFSNGLHQLLPLAYSLPNLEELSLIKSRALPAPRYTSCPLYRDSMVTHERPPKLKRLILSDCWVFWLFLEDLARLLLEPGMHAPLESLGLGCTTMDVTGHLTETLPSQTWAPVLVSIRRTLRHCTFTLLPAECSAANLAKLYGSLKRCTLLESLGILCVIRGHDTNPFLFLDALADLLASAHQDPPFPRLETLSLEFQQDREIALEDCADACTKLARALGDRSRYPHLKRLAVCASLNGWGMHSSLSTKEQREEQNTFIRSLLERVEQVGVQLEISVPG